MKKISNLLIMALLAIGMGLTSCDEQLDNAVVPGVTPGTDEGEVTSITVDLSKIDEKYLDTEKTKLQLTVGDEVTLSFTILPEEMASTEVELTAADATILSIDGLKVKALKEGETTVTAKAGDKAATCVVTVKAADPLATPLTMEAITAGTIVVTSPQAGMQYSLNGGEKTAVSGNISVSAGDKVAFYGNGTSITSYDGTKIGGNGAGFKCKVYGNIMSLVDETGFATNTTLTAENTFNALFDYNDKLTDASGLLLPASALTNSCYKSMFQNCTSLTTAPAELPATALASQCYNNMFYYCTSLTTAPAELPATALASKCYNSMFSHCNSLTTAPELKAETLAEDCYSGMFMDCTSLTTAPELKAQTLAERCYYNMFNGCTNLTTAPALPATTLANSCYFQMFRGCTSLTTAPALPATTLKESCYSNMFRGCTSLATVPETLPATTLVNSCYARMFYDCTSLTTAPKLPAETLADFCYYSMFYCCTALTNAYVKAGYTTTYEKCSEMFTGCGATGATLHTTTANKASWNGVWSNWTAADDWTD